MDLTQFRIACEKAAKTYEMFKEGADMAHTLSAAIVAAGTAEERQKAAEQALVDAQVGYEALMRRRAEAAGAFESEKAERQSEMRDIVAKANAQMREERELHEKSLAALNAEIERTAAQRDAATVRMDGEIRELAARKAALVNEIAALKERMARA